MYIKFSCNIINACNHIRCIAFKLVYYTKFLILVDIGKAYTYIEGVGGLDIEGLDTVDLLI